MHRAHSWLLPPPPQCGLGYLNPYFKDRFVGIPKALYRNSELCGLCVRIFCVDTICGESTLVNSTVMMITDSCQDCRGNDIVLAARGAAELTGVDINNNPSVQVAWEFTPCGGSW